MIRIIINFLTVAITVSFHVIETAKLVVSVYVRTARMATI